MLLVKSFKSWFDFSFDVSSKLSKTSGLLLKVNTAPITEKKNIYKKNMLKTKQELVDIEEEMKRRGI